MVIVDNLYNSSEVALDRIELICGRQPKFYKADITDKEALDKIFQENPAIDSVIHFAALKVRLHSRYDAEEYVLDNRIVFNDG